MNDEPTHPVADSGRRPLSPWDLRSLLLPVHQHRSTASSNPKDRPHFLRIAAYVYRNRYVVTSQVQRRFADILRSDRTARRHLSEMEALGYLTLAPTRSTSPLWPKVYYLTQRGARFLRQALAAKGKPGHVIRLDRSKAQGYTADHVLHEILITEFLLEVWQASQSRTDLELLKVERRSLAVHPPSAPEAGRRIAQS